MSWESGTHLTNGAGKIKDVLDVELVKNANWTLEFEPDTYESVYRCYDAAENVDYYVFIDDANAGYTVVELWEDWASGGGSGASLTVGTGVETLRLHKEAGGWGLSLRDHRFVYCNTATYSGCYIGQLNRFDTSKNMPVYIGFSGTNYTSNALASWTAANDTVWKALWDEAGNVAVSIKPNYWYSSIYPVFHHKTIAGEFALQECMVFCAASGLVMGILDGVHTQFINQDGLSNGDIVTVSGIDWICLAKNSRYALVEKA